jgi:hypothetical protein
MYSRIGLELHPVLVNGTSGFVAMRDCERFSVGGFTIRRGRIAAMDILADPARLSRLDLTVRDA